MPDRGTGRASVGVYLMAAYTGNLFFSIDDDIADVAPDVAISGIQIGVIRLCPIHNQILK